MRWAQTASDRSKAVHGTDKSEDHTDNRSERIEKN
jgi:hypothetical protein